MIIFILVSEVIYLFLVRQKLSIPILDLHTSFYLSLVIFSLFILFCIYFYFYFFSDWRKITYKQIIFVILLFNFTFLFVPFLTSNDLHSYIFQTRIWPIFGKNPYLVPYDSFPYDSFYTSIKTIWSSQTVLQGPLFLVIGGLINLIGKNNLSLITFLFKFILISANVFGAHLIYLITKNKKAVFLYGLNPLVVFELAGNVHIDSLLTLFFLTSLFLVRKKLLGSFVPLIASILIKYSTIIFLPFEIVYLFKKKGFKFFLMAMGLGFLFGIIVYLPFWKGPEIFNYLMAYYNGRYISPSLGIAFGQIIFGSYPISFHLNTLIFIFVFCILFLKFLLSKSKFDTLIFYLFILYLVYLLTKLSLVLAWDLTPLIALSSLCVALKKYRNYAVLSTFFVGIYSLLIYYFVR